MENEKNNYQMTEEEISEIERERIQEDLRFQKQEVTDLLVRSKYRISILA